MSKEILSEELLKEAVKKACELENAIYDEKAKQMPEHIFSDEYRRRMQRLIDGEEDHDEPEIPHRRIKKKSLRVKILLIAVIVMMLGGMTVIAVKPLRDKIYQIVELRYPNRTDVHFLEEEEGFEDISEKERELMQANFEIRRLINVPKEYKKESARKEFYWCWYTERYSDGKENLNYSQMPVADYSMITASDGNPAKKIKVNGEKAYLLTNGDGWHLVLYVKEGYVYELGGYLEVDKLIEILESAFADPEASKMVQEEEGWDFPCEEIWERYTVRKLKNLPEDYELSWEEEDLTIYQFTQNYYGQKESQDGDYYAITFTQQPEEYFDMSTVLDKKKAAEILVGGEKAYAMPGDDVPHRIVMLKGGMAYMIEGDEEEEVLAKILEKTVCETVPEGND